MATVTQDRLRELLARATGFYYSGTATGGSTTTIADTSTDTFDLIDDNILKGKWAHIVSDAGGGTAAPEAEVRKVSSLSTTTLTVDTAYSAACATGDTYELTPFHTLYYNDALAEALRQVYPALYLPLRDETLMVDNLLSNWDFETAGAAPPVIANWTATGSPTVTQDTTRVKHGTSAAKVVASGADGLLSQNLFNTVEINEMVGLTLVCKCHVWALAANKARIRVTFDGSTYTDGSYHGGSAEWEGPTLQYVNVAIPADATQVTMILQTVDGATAYWDVASARIEPISQYTLPTTFVSAPHRVSIQADINDPAGHYVPLRGCAPPDHILRLEGRDRLSVPTTGTGTTEIGEAQAELVIALAARSLYIRMANVDAAKRDEYREEALRWSEEASRMSRTPGIRMGGQAAFIPKEGDWRVEADSSNRYFNLPR